VRHGLHAGSRVAVGRRALQRRWMREGARDGRTIWIGIWTLGNTAVGIRVRVSNLLILSTRHARIQIKSDDAVKGSDGILMATYRWGIMALVPRGGLAQATVAIQGRVVVFRSGAIASVEGRADGRQGGVAG
jgi:hypothetical protein